jgi:type IV secretory pathway TraG/TraD family ATPase VirD4
MGNCMTKIVFSEQDPQTAEMLSKAFGECKINEYQQGVSYGASETRGSVNISRHLKTVPIIPTTDIHSLKPNQAFVKLPGKMPICKIRIGYN